MLSENEEMRDRAFAILAFGNEQLKALGEMTILFASLEEAITDFAGRLLKSFPEVAEIHRKKPARGTPVAELMFEQKQDLLKKLVRRLSELYCIDDKPLIEALGKSKRASKDRNAAVHGWLDWDSENDRVVFRHRQGALSANLPELQRIKEDIFKALENVVSSYTKFAKSLAVKHAARS